MGGSRCQVCDRPLSERAGGPGRVAHFCSPACRQRAYRLRKSGGRPVGDLIADIERQVHELTPHRPSVFYSAVSDLASSVGRLRRVARMVRDAADGDEQERPTPENVTRETVTPGAVTQPDGAAGDAGDDLSGLDEADPVVETVRSGDEWSFAGLVEPFRPELQVHCYRMVGSYDDSEDLVQETLLRAWDRRQGFAGRSSFRSWLYAIATNVCLDFLRRNSRRPQVYEPIPGITSGLEAGGAAPPPRVTWLQPYPDAAVAEPEGAAVSRETMELLFLTAIQHLPPRQRAVLVLRDVLGWPAADTAEQLDMTVASVNSALQRARPTLRKHLPPRRAEWTAPETTSAQEREILRRYMAAAERADAAAVAELLHEDVVLTMPPNPLWFVGREAMLGFISPSISADSPQYLGDWRHLPTSANRQPAAAGYLRRTGTTVFRAQVLDVLRVEAGRIVEITSFEPHLFPAFGLPLTLSGGDGFGDR